MPGILDFIKYKFQPRVVISKAADYTVTASDEQVLMTGATGRTFTLPAISSFKETVIKDKMYWFKNNGTANMTISPASGDTIDGRSNLILKPGEETIVEGTSQPGNIWDIMYPNPIPAERKNIVTLVGLTTGTTAVNLVDASGAPVNGTIVGVFVIAQDTTAGNILVKNAANTVVTIAKGVTAGALVGDAGLSNTNVTAGNVLTIESSSAGNARVYVTIESQAYTANG